MLAIVYPWDRYVLNIKKLFSCKKKVKYKIKFESIFIYLIEDYFTSNIKCKLI